MFNPTTVLAAALGVVFIGLSKAGFGGGLGMLTTPLCVLAFSAEGKDPTFAIGVLLPLLCAGDAFSLYHYWGKWEHKTLKYLLPGVVVGVVVGVQLIGLFSASLATTNAADGASYTSHRGLGTIGSLDQTSPELIRSEWARPGRSNSAWREDAGAVHFFSQSTAIPITPSAC